MSDTIYKFITVVEGTNLSKGYFFYNNQRESECDNLFNVSKLTLPKAMAILKAKGINPVVNFKMTITVYP